MTEIKLHSYDSTSSGDALLGYHVRFTPQSAAMGSAQVQGYIKALFIHPRSGDMRAIIVATSGYIYDREITSVTVVKPSNP